MTQYGFEGDIENITGRQLEFINNVIIEQGFKDSKVTIEPVGKAGDNYIAAVKRITIESPNGNLSMIAKIAPSHEGLRARIHADILFKNEHIMYTKVLPKLVQLQKDAEVPEEEQLKFAKCYGSLTEQPNEVILLEDLKASDFVMLDRFKSLSNECVLSVLKNFATLHSLSFALKEKEPDTYNCFKNHFIDMWSSMFSDTDTIVYFQHLETHALEILEDPEHKNIVKHKVGDALEEAVKMSKLVNDKYTIIQQGDAWTNNIMFRFEDGALKQSIMIDYQLSKSNTPVYDIGYMIFNCTDYETRSKYYYEWIDYYYSEFEKSLNNFGLKANFVYPRDQLDADMKRYGKLLFGLCVILNYVLTMKPEEAGQMKEAIETTAISNAMEQMPKFHQDTITLFKKRLIGLIESFKEFGLF